MTTEREQKIHDYTELALKISSAFWGRHYSKFKKAPEIDQHDLRQEAMIALIEAVDKFDPAKASTTTNDPFRMFASMVIYRHLYKFLYQNDPVMRRRPDRIQPYSFDREPSAYMKAMPLTDQDIRDLCTGLKPLSTELIVLRYHCGMKNAEIAEIYDRTENWVSFRCSAALKVLRRRLARLDMV